MYFIYHEIHPFPKYSSVVFSVFTELSVPRSSSRTFWSAPDLAFVTSLAMFLSPMPRPHQPLISHSASLHRTIPQEYNHTLCGALGLDSLSLSLFSRFVYRFNIHMRTLCIFSQPNTISLSGYVVFASSVHQLIDAWVLSPFWLLWILLPLCVYLYYRICMYVSSVGTGREVLGHLVTLVRF